MENNGPNYTFNEAMKENKAGTDDQQEQEKVSHSADDLLQNIEKIPLNRSQMKTSMTARI